MEQRHFTFSKFISVFGKISYSGKISEEKNEREDNEQIN